MEVDGLWAVIYVAAECSHHTRKLRLELDYNPSKRFPNIMETKIEKNACPPCLLTLDLSAVDCVTQRIAMRII